MWPLTRLAFTARQLVRSATGWPTRGAQVMVFDPGGRLLLVRHSYGARDQWMLPGGGIGKGESEAAAARREVREETGCRVRALEPLGVFDASAPPSETMPFFRGIRDTVHLFAGLTDDLPEPRGWEIVAARFWPPDALPPATSPATRRRVAEWQAGRFSPRW